MPITPWPDGKTINRVDATNVHPAACVFQNKLYLFWSAIDERITFSASPANSRGYPVQTWPKGATINGVDTTPGAPAACVFQNQLYLFWRANDPSDLIYFSASPDGKAWPNGKAIKALGATPSPPAACVFQNKLYLFWRAPSNLIYFSASPDGQNWLKGASIDAVDATIVAPAACVYQNQLFVFWTTGSSPGIKFSASPDGQNWQVGKNINAVDSTPSAPAALSELEEQLDLFWKANDPSNRIYYAPSGKGQTWPDGATINNVDATPWPVAGCVFIPEPGALAAVYLFWKANDASNRIYYTASSIIT